MLIVLDRDGVINYDSPDYIKSPEEWHAIPGSLEAIARLNKKGHQVVVATNQSGVGRGYFSLQTLEQIHQKMEKELAAHNGKLDGIYFCPHTLEDHCDCRKPKPGMLLRIIDVYQADLSQTILIGDSLRDLQAAEAARIRSLLVLTGKGQKTKTELGDKQVSIYEDLSQAVDDLI